MTKLDEIVNKLVESDIFHTHITSSSDGHTHKAIVATNGDGITDFSNAHSHIIENFECKQSLDHSHLLIVMDENKLAESEGGEVQSVLFNKKKYTLSRAKAWLKKNGYTSVKVDETDEYYRFRQHDPSKYDHFATGEWKDGLKVIYGYKKGEKSMKENVPIILFGEVGSIKLYEAVDGKPPKYDAHITVLAEGFSKNKNPRTKLPRYYSKEAIQSLVKLMESEEQVSVYDAPHIEDNRPSRDRIGMLEQPIYTEVGGKAFAEADLMLFSHAPLKEQIRIAPKKVGFSILADGNWDTKLVENKKAEVVNLVTSLDSVDYTESKRAAAGGKVNYLYESWQKAYEDNSNRDVLDEVVEKEKLFESVFTAVVDEKLRESNTSEERDAQDARSKKYGIKVRYDGHVTKPSEYASLDDEEFADPVNCAYPINEEHIMAAVRYWGKPENEQKYSIEERAIIEKRIERALKKYGKKTDKMNMKEGVIDVDFTELTIETLTKERPDLVESIVTGTITEQKKKYDAMKLVESRIKDSGLAEPTQKILVDTYGDGSKPLEKLDESITEYKAGEKKLVESLSKKTPDITIVIEEKDKKTSSEKLSETAGKYIP